MAPRPDASEPASPSRETFARVAVPLPLHQLLTYAVPEDQRQLARPGSRVRVPVGRRRLTGILVARVDEAPSGVEVRPLEAVIDPSPLLPPELLELGLFTADYYRAAPGEVLAALVPQGLRPWGDRRVSLTDAGALARPRSDAEARLLAELRDGGRASVASLLRRTGLGEKLHPLLERLAAEGRVRVSGGDRRGARYVTAVEPAAGSREELLERCGPAPKGRQVLEHLLRLGRPATVEEVTTAVECSPATVRRLIERRALRSFTQIQSLDLARHRLRGEETVPLVLSSEQDAAVRRLERAVEAGEGGSFLLSGITGSGKTEVYLRVAARVLESGRGVLILVPEIALVPSLLRAARQRFGGQVAILHSSLSGPERRQEWERVRAGAARLVIGPRSAVFAPLADPGLIVVDEEQEESYKQDTEPRYHARDLALFRAHGARAISLLVSATPSLESRYAAQTGRLETMHLSRRVARAEPPEGVLVDLKQEGEPTRPGEVQFTAPLRELMGETLELGGQVVLLRDRRGYAPRLLCRACGEDHRCPDCGLPRTFHKRRRALLCHFCGSRLPAPERCGSCGETALEAIGSGTERVEERVREFFPDVGVATLDRDAVRRPGGAAGVLADFESGSVRVLVGTRMVAKGHHFPRVALAAVLSADSYLSFPDFRAVERTYSLLVQLAGRAGRGERPGRMVLQTWHPEHYAIQAALTGDDGRFAEEEMRFRRIFHYPPYTRMVQFLAQDRSEERARRRVEELAERIESHPLAGEVRVSGPAPAPFERLRGRWRWQLLLRAASRTRLRELLAAVAPAEPARGLIIDVDPVQLL